MTNHTLNIINRPSAAFFFERGLNIFHIFEARKKTYLLWTEIQSSQCWPV